MNAPLSTFKFTPKQREAQRLLAGPATHVLLEGGSGSGKTMLHLRAVIARAIKASGSRHGVFRFRFNHLAASIIETLWPKVLDTCYPGLRSRIKQDRSMWFERFPNGSEIWWGGLDESDRLEKILGQEFATIYPNECSQIGWQARNMLVTRLRQNVVCDVGGSKGQALPLRMYYDCNPPNKGHWLYKVFHLGVDPVSGRNLRNPGNYARLLMNPADNADNLPASYLEELQNLSGPALERFWFGRYADDNPNALFDAATFEKWRTEDGIPRMQRVVVAVDPSGADEEHPEADEIGIIVAGLGIDGNGYVLEDLTIHASPAVWGKVAAQAVKRHNGDCVIGERNYGGAMVKYVISSTQREIGVLTRYKEVSASRGKKVRAEPLSALCAHGQVRMTSIFPELEEELCSFTTLGYTGQSSPNRADAFVFAMTELFPAIAMHNPDKPIALDSYGSGSGYDDDDDDGYSWKVA